MRMTPRVAGFKSEYPAGLRLECMAGFVGIRNDNGEICVALFEHSGDRLAAGNAQPMTANRLRLAELLARYKVGVG